MGIFSDSDIKIQGLR